MADSKVKLTTHKQIEALKPGLKDEWYSVGQGLRILVKKNGSKYWRLKYRFNKKQQTLALGVFPKVSLKEATKATTKAKALLADGIDPSAPRETSQDDESLRFYAAKWLEYECSASASNWSEEHKIRVWRRLENGLLNNLGDWSIKDVRKSDVRLAIEKIASKGKYETAKRVAGDTRRLFEFVSEQYSLDDQIDLRILRVIRVASPKVVHRESLALDNLGYFLCDLETYKSKGHVLTALALKLLLLTFVRSGELRGARWEEFDLEQKMWFIPAERMKMKRPHEVPLSKQAEKVLEEIKSINMDEQLLFPSETNPNKPMSDNTMRQAMFKMGYYPKASDTKDGKVPKSYRKFQSLSFYPDGKEKEKAVPHGFRTTAASSLYDSRLFRSEAIERQLSHAESNKVKDAYAHKAEYIEERREIMDWWGDLVSEAEMNAN